MKLIDADEFAIEEPKLWDWDSIDGISSTKVLKQCIWDVQCAPTVKAIPIEWIEEWGWKNGMSESMSLRVMIDDWEKENEIERGND